MSDMNKWMGMGRLTADPEQKSASGNSFSTFSLAVNEKRGKVETTTFVNCVAFGKLGEVVQKYVKKGQGLLVVGRLSIRKDNKGVERTGILADEVHFIGTGAKKEEPKKEEPKKEESAHEEVAPDDIPF